MAHVEINGKSMVDTGSFLCPHGAKVRVTAGQWSFRFLFQGSAHGHGGDSESDMAIVCPALPPAQPYTGTASLGGPDPASWAPVVIYSVFDIGQGHLRVDYTVHERGALERSDL